MADRTTSEETVNPANQKDLEDFLTSLTYGIANNTTEPSTPYYLQLHQTRHNKQPLAALTNVLSIFRDQMFFLGNFDDNIQTMA